MDAGADPLLRVRRYHERTKHHFDRYAPGPGYLDWSTQPHPFRMYAGAARIELPLEPGPAGVTFDDLFRAGATEPRPLDLPALGVFFELALGLSAWKEYGGSRWALRNNPSSGNLHPTEGYLVSAGAPGIAPAVYHYLSHDHVLEKRTELAGAEHEELASWLPAGAVLIGLTSIHWREAWKYGERAFRYCQHDIGHAIASLRMAGAVLGWSVLALEGPSDDDVATLLGLRHDPSYAGIDPHDREEPDLLLLAGPSSALAAVRLAATEGVARLAARVAQASWQGRANSLSPAHRTWSAIEEVTGACRKPRTEEPPVISVTTPCSTPAAIDPRNDDTRPHCSAVEVIRRRRSCVSLDGTTRQSRDSFLAVLARLLPRPGQAPWDAVSWPSRIHLLLFVHRVDGLAPGLYFLERRAGVKELLAPAMHSSFAWDPAVDPSLLPGLFLLEAGDFQHISRSVSCHQEIASDGAFSVGMIAELESGLEGGAWWYRRLFWEAGMVGHLLYLGVESEGLRGTGIGCFFDDPVHEVMGLTDRRFQSLYHFTAGGPVDDPRLRTLPAYFHRT